MRPWNLKKHWPSGCPTEPCDVGGVGEAGKFGVPSGLRLVFLVLLFVWPSGFLGCGTEAGNPTV